MVPPAALIGFSGWASIEGCRRRRVLPASGTFVQTSSESGQSRSAGRSHGTSGCPHIATVCLWRGRRRGGGPRGRPLLGEGGTAPPSRAPPPPPPPPPAPA